MDVIGEAPQNPGLGAVQYAADIHDVLKWIENPTTMLAVLVASSLARTLWYGAGNALLMGQFKSYTVGNKESLDVKTISHAPTSLHQDHWFKNLVNPLVPPMCSARSESGDSHLIYVRNSSMP